MMCKRSLRERLIKTSCMKIIESEATKNGVHSIFCYGDIFFPAFPLYSLSRGDQDVFHPAEILDATACLRFCL
uniref:Uncharacterized protein n=1 Tax=Rhizophora mucronata TaxID=61149 RepID=A0A2P2PYD1_RHIMU